MDNDKAFAKLRPTVKHTIRPGPAVAATASISLIFILLLFTASGLLNQFFRHALLQLDQEQRLQIFYGYHIG